MSNFSNHLSIYLIVIFNAACHAMLIWRLKMDKASKWKFCGLAFFLPVLIMMVMRLLVGLGLVHARVADQVGIERMLTMLASMLLLVAPLLATGGAIWFGRRQRELLAAP